MSTFTLQRQHPIESLNLTVSEYVHEKTGAVHYHLAAENEENVFLVGFRTVPTDSTGVAHILEHTTLCGSEKYPVRDPFFMMLRRSLNTFMNAFTSSDWTAYPFASLNTKDYYNLLSVYLDATFFPRLHPLDFSQEGHRVEFKEANNPESELQFKGVVFNEMKGAMSSAVSTLWHQLCAHLYPSTTYHYNSGGEPENIPDLTYEDLIAFHKKHYHPSNAIFMTFGNQPAEKIQDEIEKQVLSRFEKSHDYITIPDEKRITVPRQIEESYGFDEDPSAKTHVVVAWLLGHSADHEALLKAQLLSALLLDNSSCPLLKALETTDLGASPSPLCGLEDSNREMVFMCGLEGSEPHHAEQIEQLILSTLQHVAEFGIPLDQVEAMLHQLELSQREITGGSHPYGLQLILQALPAAIHRGNPLQVLDLDAALEKLHVEIQDPNFVKKLVQQLLLDNQHRIRYTMKPDATLNKQKEVAEAERLAAMHAKLTPEQKKKIVEDSAALAERQEQKDDMSILPKVSLSDIPATLKISQGETTQIGNQPLHCYEEGTNGLVYQDILIPMPQLSDDLMAVLPYYCGILSQVGVDGEDYLATQAWQARISGGIGAHASLRATIDSEQKQQALMILSGKALQRNSAALIDLMQKTLLSVRFDESDRIRELISQTRAAKEQGITGQGHGLAMQAAASGMSPTALLSHQLHGLLGIKQLKTLDDNLNHKRKLNEFTEKLRQIHELMLAAPKEFLLISDSATMEENRQLLSHAWNTFSNPLNASQFALPGIRQTSKQIWTTSTQVNFCAKAFPTVTSAHPDAPALLVLGGFLRNGYLHTAIREKGGAYGGGASCDSDTASFRFYSYRDPRLTETLDDFDRAIDWVLKSKHDYQPLEEAILGVIGSIDKPASPAGEAKSAFYNNYFGRTPEKRQAYRQKVLNVTLADLARVTETYLHPSKASIGILTNQANLEDLRGLRCDIFNLG